MKARKPLEEILYLIGTLSLIIFVLAVFQFNQEAFKIGFCILIIYVTSKSLQS
tara:strand:+ start:651 stop:809 length:159 start_codon:yes stop_codon:yes gene_type:complete